MSRSAFFDAVIFGLRQQLPPERGSFKMRRFGPLLKVFYENERIHYEVHVDGQAGHVEVGLHFEDGPVSTAAYLRFFDARIVELKDVLGPEIELERWTMSWGRLFTLLPGAALDNRRVADVVSRLTEMIRVLQPLVELADIPPERSAEDRHPGQPSWRRRRR